MEGKTLGWVPGGTGRIAPFDSLFDNNVMLDQGFSPDDVAKCDAVVIWGGGDISPALYNDVPGDHMYKALSEPSRKDKLEWSAIQAAHSMGIPVIGVCRGAQMLCAAAGGALWQHTDIHGATHDMVTRDGQRMATSSVHHQMMRPDGTDHEVIAVDPREQTVYDSSSTAHVLKESPEIIHFNTWGLAIQGHPEFMRKDSEFVQYCLGLINDRIIK